MFFFFKQKTAYEMRISDWSSDVCSSDLVLEQLERLHLAAIIRESEKHAVELPAMERIAGRLAGFLAEEQLEVRPFPAQLRQQGGEQERGDGGDDAHPQFARQGLAGRPCHVRKLLGLAQDTPRLLRDPIAQRGEAHHAPRTLHEHAADQRLQLDRKSTRLNSSH